MTARKTATYFVRYRGLPQPRDEFLAYYRGRHARILRDLPGIRGLVLHVPAQWRDPFPVDADATDFLAEMTFDSVDALTAALASDVRERARRDFAALPRGAATVTHQAMQSARLL